ncbi:MAG TPA: TetR family transcriptional regulator C-terminal domain-containing protein [Streptosporangiaceae bacterium]|nr:TetR family transcriptional regulator C-terminal domain-containing protein [Streptosporangiaceae bacterium]
MEGTAAMTVGAAEGAEALGTADQRREQMLHAALEVISARGYADTRIADVAERAGVSPALVIYYFKTKDQLLTEAIRYYEDNWYAVGQTRLAQLRSAAERLEEVVAMSCLNEADPKPESSWQLWLDFWAQAARNAEVAGVRQKSDERWRDLIATLVNEGQEAGEFRQVDTANFALYLSSLLDGLTIQIALNDPVVDSVRAFELSMQFVADQLGFDWKPERSRVGQHHRGRGAGGGQRQSTKGR